MPNLFNLTRPGTPPVLTILLASLLLSACNVPAEDPKSVADKYWQSLQTGNTSEAKKLASINSQPRLESHSNYITPGTSVTNSDSKTTVTTTVTRTDSGTQKRYSESFDTVLILEQGRWKVDIDQSQPPAAVTSRQEEMEKLAEDLSESMQQNIDSIDEAMSQGIELLDEALQDGSREMSQSLLEMMKELNNNMQQSIDKMKERHQQQMEQQPPPKKPDPDQGEGMI